MVATRVGRVRFINCGYGLVVERDLPKVETRVRFSVPAPNSMNTQYQQFENLINPDTYQVFLMSCPAFFPFNFTRHPWFVVNKKGELSRWEVYSQKNLFKTNWGYLCQNGFFISPFQGIQIFSFSKTFFWKPSLLRVIEGDENSLAYNMIQTIELSPEHYPFCDTYVFTGPNSNTYVQWLLNKFPELSIKLPWRCFGKGFRLP